MEPAYGVGIIVGAMIKRIPDATVETEVWFSIVELLTKFNICEAPLMSTEAKLLRWKA